LLLFRKEKADVRHTGGKVRAGKTTQQGNNNESAKWRTGILNGGLGNMGVSVMQLVAPLVVSLSIFAAFGSHGVEQPDGSQL
ncbi:hypothetical protein KU710_24165, partial [Salmonella enterica subsp. enterica serovar Give]|nr:hypothetical protein [Salmonella enterica subsp. enterica serovar Give]